MMLYEKERNIFKLNIFYPDEESDSKQPTNSIKQIIRLSNS
jgi:hypothetical protein